MAYLQELGKAKAYKELISLLSGADESVRRITENLGTSKSYAIGQATPTPATK